MPTVEVPDFGEIDFPDSMSQEEIRGVLAKKFPPKTPSLPAVSLSPYEQYRLKGGEPSGPFGPANPSEVLSLPQVLNIPSHLIESSGLPQAAEDIGSDLLRHTGIDPSAQPGESVIPAVPDEPALWSAARKFATPGNLLLAPLAALRAPGIIPAFEAQMVSGVPGALQTFQNAKDQKEATEALVAAGLGLATGAHLVSGADIKPVSEAKLNPELPGDKGVINAKDQIESTSGVPFEQQGVPTDRGAEGEVKTGVAQRGGESEQAVSQPAEVSKEIERVPPSEVAGRAKPSEAPVSAAVESSVAAEGTPQANGDNAAPQSPDQLGSVTHEVTPDILGFIESQADQARARLKAKEGSTTFGSGPLHELPNIRDYAIIGAAKIARGAVDFAKWSGEMIKEFGERISPHLQYLFDASQEAVKEHTGVVERVRQVLQEAELASKSIAKGISSQVGKAIEAGAEAGERLAKAEAQPKLQSLTQQLTDSIPKAEALRTYFSGQEKGGAAGRKAATKELKLADRWLEADAGRVRDSLTELVKTLPLAERGRFVQAIANATKRPPIVGGDPASMYRNAAQVAARIADRAVEVQKTDTINEIKATADKAIKSPSVDIGYKSKILDAIGRLSFTKPSADTLAALKSTREYLARMEAAGKDVEMPKEVLDSLEVLSQTPAKEMPLNVLEAIRDRVQQLHDLGRLKVKSRKQAWEIEKAAKTRELINEKTNPLEARPEFQPQPGENKTMTMKVRNWMNRTMNMGAVFDRAILPIDALFELLGDAKGTYKGWLFKNVRNPLDLDYNAAQVMRDRLIAPVEKLIKDNKMGQKEAERIGVYAEAQQEGGLERMTAQGVKPETISKILDSITPAELAVYKAMRKAMDSTLPEMQKLMHELYNIDVKPVENYFPMQRAWDLYEPEPQGLQQPKFGQPMDFDDLAGWKQMLGDYMNPKTTKTQRGFTLDRQPGAETPIKLNAFDVFHSHLNDVAYLLKTQRNLKMIGEMVRDDSFVEKYGKLGQTVVNNWLDTVARQGKVNASQKWLALDALRRRTSAGVIGFRLASQFVHLSNVPLGIWRTGGPGWYSAGLREALSPEGQSFLKDNFSETFTRGGGEPAITEAANKATTLFGKTVIPKSVNKAAFAIARGVDRYNSQAIVLGTYLRLLKEKGIDFNRYDEIPVDKESQAQALVLSRRAVASPLPKDVSQQLSRGALTGGNVSIGRTIMQFQNIFQDQWSNIRVDLARSGIYEKNPRLAATAFVSLLAMGLAEIGIREASRQAINAVTGYKPKHERDIPETLLLEGARRIPLGGQIASEILYGETGIPVLDSIVNLAKSIHTAATASKTATQDKATIRAVSGAAQLAGVPGASQAGELLEKAY